MIVKASLFGLLCHSSTTLAFHHPTTSSILRRSIIRTSTYCRPNKYTMPKMTRLQSTSSDGSDQAAATTAAAAAQVFRGGKVIIVGSINQDLTTYAPTLPTPGQTILGSDFITTPGGKGANQAVAASSTLQGATSSVCGGEVHMIGRVGNDVMGHSLLSSLRSKGVKLGEDDEATVDNGAHTGVASIIVDSNSGQNTIVVAPGANMALSKEDVHSSLTKLLKNDNKGGGRDVVLVQLEITPETALQSLQTASNLGALTILNPAPAPKGWELNDEWYSSIDILIPNETELASLCGVVSNYDVSDLVTGEGEEAMARSLLERGVRHAVIVTLGERGAMIVRRRRRSNDESENNTNDVDDDSVLQTTMISEPSDLPCKNQPVVDAVGAGDAFCGALAAYLSHNHGGDGVELDVAASMACGVASMSVRKRGAQESYPSAKDLPDCLRLDNGDAGGTASLGMDDGGDCEIKESLQMKKKTITFVTGNKNKLAEVQRLLSTSASTTSSSASSTANSIPFDIDNVKLDLPELQGTPEEIAREKCQTASQQLQTAVLTEDTCLCFRALDDLPGPYIKWFLDKLGHDGLNKLLDGFHDDDDDDDDNRAAYAQTIIAFSPGPGKEVQLFDGRTEGRIVPARGSLDFGWDPVFEPTEEEQGGRKKTYAEMTKDEKNAISHRGRAFRKFREYLSSEADDILKDLN